MEQESRYDGDSNGKGKDVPGVLYRTVPTLIANLAYLKQRFPHLVSPKLQRYTTYLMALF